MTGPDSLTAALEGPDEEAVAGGWLTAFGRWSGRVRSQVMAPFTRGRSMPDAGAVLSINGVWVQELERNVGPPIIATLRRAYAAARGQQPPDGFDESVYVTRYLGASINRMSNVPHEVYRLISGVIADGVEANESIADIAARVDDVLLITGSDRWTNRSVVVARTEVGAAVNAGTLAAAGQRQRDTGRPMVKTWIATTHGASATTTRPAHLEADGQTVPITQPFMVGGEPLQFPGDPSGSAGNVIQCRCTLSTRAAEER